jgi:hypothetical protein
VEHQHVRSLERNIEPVEIQEVAVPGVDSLPPETRWSRPAEQVREERLALGPGRTPGRAEGLGGRERHRDRSRLLASVDRCLGPPDILAGD